MSLVFGYNQWDLHRKSNSILTSQLTTKYSLMNAPSKSLKGEIVSMSGMVTLHLRNSTKTVRVKSPIPLQQGEEISIGSKGKAVVQIQDDALFTVSSDSQINLIQLLPINLVVKQNIGDIYYQTNGNAGVTVISFGLLTGMSRGWATVSIGNTNNEKIVTILVKRGYVTEGYLDKQKVPHVVSVTEGDKFIYNENTRNGTVYSSSSIPQNSLPF